MNRHGQVFQLAPSSQWAYRYRAGGRGSRRFQRGGFESEQAAAEALDRQLERLRREEGLVETIGSALVIIAGPPEARPADGLAG